MLLGALVFDGVLERHPKLSVIIEEVGASWLPHLLAVLDRSVGRLQSQALIYNEEERPSYAGSAYKLPLAPSEYLTRQVKVTPLVATEPLRPTLDLTPDILCFSSDYPHVEGTGSAVSICERQLGDLDWLVRAEFYNGVGRSIGL